MQRQLHMHNYFYDLWHDCNKKVTNRNYIQKQVDVLPSKNQVLCEFCTCVNQLKHC